MYTELSYDVDGHVGVITLRRPEARNALTYTTYRELEDAVRTATVRVRNVVSPDIPPGTRVKLVAKLPS